MRPVCRTCVVPVRFVEFLSRTPSRDPRPNSRGSVWFGWVRFGSVRFLLSRAPSRAAFNSPRPAPTLVVRFDLVRFLRGQAAGINQVVSSAQVKLSVLAQSCLCPGWAAIVANLLESRAALPPQVTAVPSRESEALP